MSKGFTIKGGSEYPYGGSFCFDEPTRLFINKIKQRKPVEPKEWHKELKSYEKKNGCFYTCEVQHK